MLNCWSRANTKSPPPPEVVLREGFLGQGLGWGVAIGSLWPFSKNGVKTTWNCSLRAGRSVSCLRNCSLLADFRARFVSAFASYLASLLIFWGFWARNLFIVQLFRPFWLWISTQLKLVFRLEILPSGTCFILTPIIKMTVTL